MGLLPPQTKYTCPFGYYNSFDILSLDNNFLPLNQGKIKLEQKMQMATCLSV